MTTRVLRQDYVVQETKKIARQIGAMDITNPKFWEELVKRVRATMRRRMKIAEEAANAPTPQTKERASRKLRRLEMASKERYVLFANTFRPPVRPNIDLTDYRGV